MSTDDSATKKPAAGAKGGRRRTPSNVQSLERTVDLLELVARADGSIRLSDLASASGLPLPTIHRLMQTLVYRGYITQQPSRRYSLGPRLIWLGEIASREIEVWARPFLQQLVEATGETANMAMMDGDEIVYVAQVPSKHSMRMFTEVGRRVAAHCTGVGKVLLAQLEPEKAMQLVDRTGLPARTSRTITDKLELAAELDRIRGCGYAVDKGEQEIGVQCIAVPVVGGLAPIAFSVSGPDARLCLSHEQQGHLVPIMQRISAEFAVSLSR
jgi:IclR family transcriptional regulator, acetate operon repressor